MFGLPSEVYVVLDEGPDLQPLLATNERLARELRAELPGLAFQPPSRLLPVGSAPRPKRAAHRARRR